MCNGRSVNENLDPLYQRGRAHAIEMLRIKNELQRERKSCESERRNARVNFKADYLRKRGGFQPSCISVECIPRMLARS